MVSGIGGIANDNHDKSICLRIKTEPDLREKFGRKFHVSKPRINTSAARKEENE